MFRDQTEVMLDRRGRGPGPGPVLTLVRVIIDVEIVDNWKRTSLLTSYGWFVVGGVSTFPVEP